jgi:hypothetical protein
MKFIKLSIRDTYLLVFVPGNYLYVSWLIDKSPQEQRQLKSVYF